MDTLVLESSLLQDALAFIDAFEEDHRDSSPSSADTSARPAAAAKKPRRKAQPCTREQARSRGDYKAELEFLRRDVAELETQLTQLKQQAVLLVLGSDNTDCTAPVLAWKRVAERQLMRRNQSQLTNKNLKTMVAKQLRVAKSLHSLFIKRSNEKESELVVNTRASVFAYASALVYDDEQVHALLMKRLHRHYIGIDVCLQNTNLMQAETIAINTRQTIDPQKGTVMESTSSAPVPISLEEADRLAWWCGIHNDAADAENPRLTLYNNDSVVKKYRSSVSSLDYACNLRTQSVVHRFVERNRVVIAWSSIIATQNCATRITVDGMTIMERHTVTPMQTTMLKYWCRTAVDSLAPRNTQDDFAQRAVCEEHVSTFQAFENSLLDLAVEKDLKPDIRFCIY